jgi:GAF domain-containing protein
MERSSEALIRYRRGELPLEEFHRTVCREITERVGSTRAGIWFFNETCDRITCAAQYDQRAGHLDGGAVLRAADARPYFDAVLREYRVVAPEVVDHPAAACLAPGYFQPNDIRSLLDHVILVGGVPKAILCCEHCGERKCWTGTDLDYLQLFANLVAFAFENSS